MSSNDNDNFFDIYKHNIACYYNRRKLLKIINDGTANIPPTMHQMLKVYESNSEKIKKFDVETYDDHYLKVKQVLCQLFNPEERQKGLFNKYLDYFTQERAAKKHYNDYLARLAKKVFIQD